MTDELSKGFTGVEINGVRFSNIQEVLIYMNEQRDRIINLEQENAELKERIKTLTIHDTNAVLSGLEMKVLKESHKDRANKTQEQFTKAKDMIKELYEGLDKLYLSGLSDKQITFVEQLQDKAEQFLNSEEA